MKNTIKLFGIALVALIGLSFAACDNDPTINNGGDDGKTEKLAWPDNLTGTWRDDDYPYPHEIVFGDKKLGSTPGPFKVMTVSVLMERGIVRDHILREIRENNIYKIEEILTMGAGTRYRIITLVIGTDGKLTVDFDAEASLELEPKDPLENYHYLIEGVYTKQTAE